MMIGSLNPSVGFSEMSRGGGLVLSGDGGAGFVLDGEKSVGVNEVLQKGNDTGPSP
jgi:hypothetical protein